MAWILIREIDWDTVKRLEERAKRQGRPLNDELRLILEQAARREVSAVAALAAKIRRRLAGRRHTDSAVLVSEDRQR